MKRTIKILSVISLCIILLSIVDLLVGYAFWTPLAEQLYGQYYGQNMQITVPMTSVFSLASQLVMAVLMVAFAGRHRTGIWVEIVTVAWYGLSNIVTLVWWMLQNMVLDQLLFRYLSPDAYSLYSASNSLASLLWSVATALNNVSVALILLVCGLSVVYKLYQKKHPQGCQNIEPGEYQQSDFVQ